MSTTPRTDRHSRELVSEVGDESALKMLRLQEALGMDDSGLLAEVGDRISLRRLCGLSVHQSVAIIPQGSTQGTSMLEMIPRTRCGSPGWLAIALGGLATHGCAIVEDVIEPPLRTEARVALKRVQAAVLRDIGPQRLERARELGVVRLPMLYEPVFFRLLSLPAVISLVDATVSETAVLHLQNGLVLPSLLTRPEDCFQLQFHMDFRRVLNGYLCSVNTLLALDEFTGDNGGTLVVPGSHQRLEPLPTDWLRSEAVAAQCPAGSMLAFDSTVWHAAGFNVSGKERLAVNQQFTRSYFKQQID